MRTLFKLMTLWLAGAAFSMAVAAPRPFDQAAFDKAVAAGGPVIVQFHADWCPTCRAQKPVVEQVLNEPAMKPVQFFIADFDTERALKKALRVSQQSTFVVFKGGKEVTRSTGQTTRPGIEAVFAQAL
jgi:thiol-disulfide isomerase/thioredoxin